MEEPQPNVLAGVPRMAPDPVNISHRTEWVTVTLHKLPSLLLAGKVERRGITVAVWQAGQDGSAAH